MQTEDQLDQRAASFPEDMLGERLRTIRESLNLTHDGLSKLTKAADQEGRGISRTTIRGYELGTFKPGAREIRILCQTLHKSPTWLLLGDGEGSAQGSMGVLPTGTPSWAECAMGLISYLKLSPDEQRQSLDIIKSLYRLRAGEISFRVQSNTIHKVIDPVQDYWRDREEAGEKASQAEIREVFVATVAAVKADLGEAEAALLDAIFGPVIKYFAGQK